MDFKADRLELATRVLKARLAKGLTQAQLAKVVECTQSAIHQIESGKVMPKQKTLFALGRALDVPVGTLYSDTVPNRILGQSLLGVLWIRIHYWWYRRKRNIPASG